MSILEFVCLRVFFHTVHNRGNTTCCTIPIDTICICLYSLLYQERVSRENLKRKSHRAFISTTVLNPDSCGAKISLKMKKLTVFSTPIGSANARTDWEGEAGGERKSFFSYHMNKVNCDLITCACGGIYDLYSITNILLCSKII